MLRMLLLAIALMAASCAKPKPKPNRPSWFIESDDRGIVKVRLGQETYTAVCEHYVVLATHTVREGPSACEIPATVAGRTIPTANRKYDSLGQVVITELTILQQGEEPYRLVLRRYSEGDPAGGIYESFQVVGYWPKHRPKRQPFIRPIYITEDA